MFQTNSAIAQSRQEALEEQNENLDRCLAVEKRLAGREESVIEALKNDLKRLESSQQAQAALVAGYENLHSPLLDSARDRSKLSESAIEAERVQVRENEQHIRDRQWEIGELTRWKGEVSDRLSDPGKLRPELGFDDYLSALSKHIVAFILMSIIVGVLLEGISTPGSLEALESFLFGAE